jgi:hypothetical protein
VGAKVVAVDLDQGGLQRVEVDVAALLQALLGEHHTNRLALALFGQSMHTRVVAAHAPGHGHTIFWGQLHLGDEPAGAGVDADEVDAGGLAHDAPAAVAAHEPAGAHDLNVDTASGVAVVADTANVDDVYVDAV